MEQRDHTIVNIDYDYTPKESQYVIHNQIEINHTGQMTVQQAVQYEIKHRQYVSHFQEIHLQDIYKDIIV